MGKHGDRNVPITLKLKHRRPFMDRSNKLLKTHLIEHQNKNTRKVFLELISRN
jgi:hypothetical protein